MFDGSDRAFDDNVEVTARLVAVARAVDPGIAVEGEIGRIGGSEDSDRTTRRAGANDSRAGCGVRPATGVDVVAPALGNLHRMPDDCL